MAKKASVSVDEVLNNGLRALALADGPRKLTGKGDPPSVFGTTAAGKQAAAACLAVEDPLVRVQGSAKAATVALTATGFERIAGTLPEDRIGPAAKGIAEGLPAAERVDFLQRVVARAPVATADLLPVLEAAVAQEKAEREAEAERQARRRAAEAASLAALERWKALVEARRRERVEALRRELAAEGGEPPRPAVAPPPAGGRPEPQTRDDFAFRRDVAHQLAASWKATWDPDRPDVRDYLESAMWNVRGLRLVGEPGGQVAFDGRYHECAVAVSAGEPVRVARPGWVLEEGDGAEYVVLKAWVERRG